MGRAAADRACTFAENRAVGGITLAVRASGAVTRRARVREDGPLRVRCPGPISDELEAVIVNTGGGVAGGDRLRLDVTVEPGARLVVTTAAAEKVYRTLEAAATIDVKLSVGAAASLAWMPQEMIVFDRARLKRAIDIDLAADARLLLAEAIVFGRSGMGEAVHDGFLFDRWRLRRGGRLIHAEAMRLDGAVANKLAQPAVAKGGIALATVLIVPGEEAAGVRALGNRLRGEAGASTWNGLTVVRLCAPDGAALRHDLLAVLAVLRGAPLPRLWLN
ncbi:MAG: urease accessory protein ureD [Alphaproteobacteria bacterium 13_2_20CM_2_64_7]|nr:MAG: urease accessory protein ureD [Alphaproteobacteria bacterium 13_2_20CM_2_64_7]